MLFICLSLPLFAQQHDTVDLGDEVYDFITIAEQKGYCSTLSNVKPYTQKYVISVLEEIKDSIEDLQSSDSKYKFYNKELDNVNFLLNRYYKKVGIDWSRMSIRFENNNDGFPMSMEFNNTPEFYMTSGFYDNKELNATGFELFNNFNFLGDLGNDVSYRCSGYFGFTAMPLQEVGEYTIGYWWYDDWRDWEHGYLDKDDITKRTLHIFRNNCALPYSYKKKWDGSVYFLSFLNCNGLQGWPTETALAFGMYGEMRTNLVNDRISLGISRVNREWAGMDYGSSLVLNRNAQPFIALDASVQLLDWFRMDALTGVLEFPNAGYTNENAWYMLKQGRKEDCVDAEPVQKDPKYTVEDSYFFQNAYSIGMVNVDLPYFHADFGSSCIWPKRFEIGYMFPLIDRVVYQNSVGDYDNLALFGDLKGYLPGVGSMWFSAYIDELNSLNPKLFEKTRCMFSYQFGSKVNIPFLPFATLSARYTKIEPYCYTHQAIRKQPWYSEYISEAYMNNGKPLGYYLDPNSDEIFVRLDTKPAVATSLSLQYQLIRHGADYGSGAVIGSSLYSEMPTGIRDSLYKYFLHDGVYEWMNIITLEGAYNLNALKVPAQITCSVGYLYSYFTKSTVPAEETTTPYSKYKKSAYEKINTAEYPVKSGFVVSVGIKLFAFDMCQ